MFYFFKLELEKITLSNTYTYIFQDLNGIVSVLPFLILSLGRMKFNSLINSWIWEAVVVDSIGVKLQLFSHLNQRKFLIVCNLKRCVSAISHFCVKDCTYPPNLTLIDIFYLLSIQRKCSRQKGSSSSNLYLSEAGHGNR